MKDYWFIYKDSNGWFNTTTNLVFIAEHKRCKAFKKEEFKTAQQAIRHYEKLCSDNKIKEVK